MPDENNAQAEIIKLMDRIQKDINEIEKEISSQELDNLKNTETVPPDFLGPTSIYETISNDLKIVIGQKDYIIKLFSGNNGKLGKLFKTNPKQNILPILYDNLFDIEKVLISILDNPASNTFPKNPKDTINETIKYLNICKDLDPVLSILDTFSTDIIKIKNNLYNTHKSSTEYLNEQGLCEAFFDRSNNLKKTSLNWLYGVGGIILIIITSLLFFALNDYSYLNETNIDFILKKHIFFIPCTMLLFWLLWFFLKKHFYYAQLSDDYNYKNDISKAYYGYKNEILPTDKDALKLEDDALKDAHVLRLKLLDNVLAIITKNPVESGLKTDTSPYTEIISKLLDQVKKDK